MHFHAHSIPVFNKRNHVFVCYNSQASMAAFPSKFKDELAKRFKAEVEARKAAQAERASVQKQFAAFREEMCARISELEHERDTAKVGRRSLTGICVALSPLARHCCSTRPQCSCHQGCSAEIVVSFTEGRRSLTLPGGWHTSLTGGAAAGREG